MVDWATINPALVRLVTELAIEGRAQGAWSAEWRDRPVRMVDPNAKLQITLKITNISAIGEDETRYEHDPQTNALVATQTGQRRFTLQLQGLTTEHTDHNWALAVLERVRSRLSRPRSLDALAAVGVAVIRTETVVDTPLKRDGRWFPGAVLDVILGAVMNEADPEPTGWIQYVVLSSQTKDADGQLLPAALQLDDHDIPSIPPPP